jgi:hypothetical protein
MTKLIVAFRNFADAPKKHETDKVNLPYTKQSAQTPSGVTFTKTQQDKFCHRYKFKHVLPCPDSNQLPSR